MNTFHIYMMHLDDYHALMQEEMMSDEMRQLQLQQKLLISGNNRHIITEILHLHQENALIESQQHTPNLYSFGLKYHQIQVLLRSEVRAATGHFSNTIYLVNLAAFYYLSFHLAHDLTVVFTKQDSPHELESHEDKQNTLSSPYNRFYQGKLKN